MSSAFVIKSNHFAVYTSLPPCREPDEKLYAGWNLHTILNMAFVILGLTFWKGPGSIGALTALTLWPMSCFPKSLSRCTPTWPSTLEKTPIWPWAGPPFLWKQQPLPTDVAPARQETHSNRERGKKCHQIWPWPRQNLVSQRQPIK